MKEITATIIIFVYLMLCAGHFVPALALVFDFLAAPSFVVLILVNVFCPDRGQSNKQVRAQRFDTPRFHLQLNNENIYAGVCGMSVLDTAYICLGKVCTLATALWAMKNNTKYSSVKARIYQQVSRL